MLPREVGRKFVKLCEVAVLFFHSRRFFRDLLFQIVHQTFQALGHGIKAAADLLEFSPGPGQIHTSPKITARHGGNAFSQTLNRADHPTQQESHDDEKASDCKHNHRQLNPALLPIKGLPALLYGFLQSFHLVDEVAELHA